MTEVGSGWTATELLQKEFKPRPWIIESLLPTGLGFLVARSKIGKSWMIMTMATACGFKNGTALGEYRACPGGVIYLDLEVTERVSQMRLRKILEFYSQNGTSEPPICFHGWNDWPKFPRGLDALKRQLDAKPEVRLVVIDPLAMLWPAELKSGGRNAYYVEYDLLSQLKKVADQRELSIVCVHHESKGEKADPLDRVSGTAALPAVSDVMWILERPRHETHSGPQKGSLFVTGREVEERTLQLLKDPYAGWIITHDPILERKTDGPKEASLFS